MTEIVVQKYGGSSVADIAKLERVADRVTATAYQGRKVCVVVSAMGRTTDDLIRLANQITDSPPRRELDMLLSSGERIAMALLAMAIQKRGLEAISFTGSQSGIITNDRHSGARIIEVRPSVSRTNWKETRWSSLPASRECPIAGRSPRSAGVVPIRLLSPWRQRLGASCEICSDVDGVYTADPRVVPEAQRLDSISYEEMQELAEHGAKVLNAQAVEWARRSGIRVYARATHAEGGGTQVGAQDSGREACGVATATGLVRLHLKTNAAVLGAHLAEADVSLWRLSDDGTGAVALFSTDDLPDWVGLKRSLQERFGAQLEVAENLAAVSVVGTALGSANVSARALGEAERSGVQILGIDTSPLRITLLVSPQEAAKLARALHAIFLPSP